MLVALVREMPAALRARRVPASGDEVRRRGAFARTRVGTTVWDHLEAAFVHLRDVVGVGAHGLLRVRHGDWNDGITVEVPAAKVPALVARGESSLTTAMASYVLPRFAALARARGRGALARSVGAFDAELRRALRGMWNGRWFNRIRLEDGTVVGADRLYLEPQPWAVLGGVCDARESRALLRRVDADLRSNSPLGCRLYSAPPEGLVDDVMGMPLGECSNGGVWYSINHTVIAAAAEHAPDLAWDEFLRSTLAQHARCFPDQWIGIWSGPDSYNCDWSDRPGWTWDCPGVGMYCSRHPIQNMHAHAQPLLSFLRIAGVGCDADGLVIRPRFPDGTGDSWSFHQRSRHGLSVSYAPECVSGRFAACGPAASVRVALPPKLAAAGDGALAVTGNAARVTFTRSDDGAEVTVLLIGPAADDDGDGDDLGGAGEKGEFDTEASRLHVWKWQVAARTAHKL